MKLSKKISIAVSLVVIFVLALVLGVPRFTKKTSSPVFASPPVGPSLVVQQAGTTIVPNTHIENFVSGCTVTQSGVTAAITCAGSGGTVTSVNCGDGLSCTPDPIVGAGDITVDSTVVRTSGTQSVGGAKTFTTTLTCDPSTAVTPLTVDGNNQTNVPVITITGQGAGVSGIQGSIASGGAYWLEELNANSYRIQAQNRAQEFYVNNEASDTATHAFLFYHTSLTASDVSMRVRGQASQTGDLMQWQTSTPTTVAKVSITGDVTGRRVAEVGTALVAGDFALSAGWGSTASVGTITGSDGAARYTITASGVGQAANPTTTLTFKDGTWTNAPICQAKIQASSDPLGLGTPYTDAPTATTLVSTYNGTPVAGSTYTVSHICVGR